MLALYPRGSPKLVLRCHSLFVLAICTANVNKLAMGAQEFKNKRSHSNGSHASKAFLQLILNLNL